MEQHTENEAIQKRPAILVIGSPGVGKRTILSSMSLLSISVVIDCFVLINFKILGYHYDIIDQFDGFSVLFNWVIFQVLNCVDICEFAVLGDSIGNLELLILGLLMNCQRLAYMKLSS